jgi:ABC-type transport system involved in multi-copper enzyme maturation permease subunit
MDFLTIFNYELKSLVKSTKSTILSLILVSFCWGIFFALNIFTGLFDDKPDEFLLIWFLFFALVASSGFANISFARERLSGAFEILFASGISRITIFLAKLAFVQSASFLWGILSLIFAVLSAGIFGIHVEFHDFIFFALLLFFCTTLLINTICACLTIININQRAINMINIAVLAILSSVIYYIDAQTMSGKITIVFIIILPTVPLFLFSRKALFEDKAIQNIVY